MKEILLILILWNGFTFLLMGMDKGKAKRQERRISEETLLLSALLLGGIGSLAGSLYFRHKTRKWKFRILLPLAAAITVIMSGVILTIR